MNNDNIIDEINAWLKESKHNKPICVQVDIWGKNISGIEKHLPFCIIDIKGDTDRIHVRFYKDVSSAPREYDADLYYLNHFYELLNKEGIYIINDKWVSTHTE